MRGNNTDLVKIIIGGGIVPSLEEDVCFPTILRPRLSVPRAGLAIQCGDGENVTSHDHSWWRRYIDN